MSCCGEGPCCICPNPETSKKFLEQAEALAGDIPKLIEFLQNSPRSLVRHHIRSIFTRFGINLPIARTSRAPGLDDGAPGLQLSGERAPAPQEAPLRGTVRVIVVLVNFKDRKLTRSASSFKDLFFSSGTLASGSVKEFFQEASRGMVNIAGEVIGPLTLPGTNKTYADDGDNGLKGGARLMADAAVVAADPTVNFAQYDNRKTGVVDAFIVVHPGSGAEESGKSGDMWSHKWNLPRPRRVDGVSVSTYLTVPEDCKLGVCAHELGHLLFGWPDLYDSDYSSAGVGEWCLMGGGSWLGGGDTPCHPSAWCKATQGWIDVVNVKTTTNLDVVAIEQSNTAFRAWTRGAGGSEYFLIENRQLLGYDRKLPSPGLLIWHVDETRPDNSDDKRPLLALVQADGRNDLKKKTGRGDGGDPYPGTSNNRLFSDTTTPNSKSNLGARTNVTIKVNSTNAQKIPVMVSVAPGSNL